MSLTARDRKIVLVIVPLVVLLGYWFLLLSPERKEASEAAAELSKQQKLSDQASSQLAQLQSAKTSFASDYSQLVQLGKAIPSSVDMPSLIVQLDQAARGTGIKFRRIATGERQPAPAATPPAQGGSGQAGDSGGAQAAPATPPVGGTTPAGEGGATAQSGPGKATESANNASAATQESQDTKTSEQAREGKLPVGGGAAPASPQSAAGACAPGLECIPLEFEFDGRFFQLADFFHRLKRFVAVANDDVLVRGRLLTIDGLKFSSGELFPRLKAEIKATVYLAPKAEGVTAGATPAGPGATTPAASAGRPRTPSSATAPTATATP